MKHNGEPVNSQCNFQFMLFDAANDGAQLGTAQIATAVNVTDGLFTVQLNGNNEFGANAFTGSARWLQIGVQCATDSAPVVLTLQLLTAAPYALTALKATTAISATTALTAARALQAETALTANTATTALTATTAINANTAFSATMATRANIAVNALSATVATTAISATTATSATNALSTAALQGYVVSTTAPTTGQVLKWNGNAWAPGNDLATNDMITEVTAGAGLTGGGANGKITLGVSVPFALSGMAANGNALIFASNAGSQGIGLYGIGPFAGVKGISQANDVGYGVYGESRSIVSNSAGVYGYALNASGVAGKSTYSTGVTGQGTTGVIGLSSGGAASGSLGTETRGVGIGVIGHAAGFGVSAESYGGGVAIAAVATGSKLESS